ncbi:MAG: cbb3-type cytochrome c oxidase subunit I [Proteobacteria bacterium]|nr:cbb3-type cytochrome c oxidase subunit I [Pseudomonadota bacterium]
MPTPRHPLIKFVMMSTTFFFVGTVHGVLQVTHPIRAWLDSIGSPYGGPGRMIDPLAHAHINMVGGVVLLVMAVSYYLLPILTQRPLYSQRLVGHTFWWITLGVTGFYSTLLTFGIWEGHLLLTHPAAIADVHRYYSPIIATVSTAMGIGFWCYFANIFLTLRNFYKTRG